MTSATRPDQPDDPDQPDQPDRARPAPTVRAPRAGRWPAAVDAPDVARRQAGTFTRQQARDAGWSPAQVKHRLRTGAWRRLAGRALVTDGSTVGPPAGVWAVHLTWPHAVASHTTAAAVYGWPVPDGVLHATSAAAVRSLRDLRVHRVALGADETRRLARGGPAVTTPRRTALDCLRLLDPDDGERLLAWCLTREVLCRDDLRQAVLDGCGRPGTPALLRLLRGSAGNALSRAERRLHDLLRRGGITGWVANATVRDARGVAAVVDLLFPAHRVVIEVDGWAAHGGREAFERDRRRQNRLVNAGFTVLRFTWDDLTHRGDEVVAEIRTALSPKITRDLSDGRCG